MSLLLPTYPHHFLNFLANTMRNGKIRFARFARGPRCTRALRSEYCVSSSFRHNKYASMYKRIQAQQNKRLQKKTYFGVTLTNSCSSTKALSVGGRTKIAAHSGKFAKPTRNAATTKGHKSTHSYTLSLIHTHTHINMSNRRELNDEISSMGSTMRTTFKSYFRVRSYFFRLRWKAALTQCRAFLHSARLYKSQVFTRNLWWHFWHVAAPRKHTHLSAPYMWVNDEHQTYINITW